MNSPVSPVKQMRSSAPRAWMGGEPCASRRGRSRSTRLSGGSVKVTTRSGIRRPYTNTRSLRVPSRHFPGLAEPVDALAAHPAVLVEEDPKSVGAGCRPVGVDAGEELDRQRVPVLPGQLERPPEVVFGGVHLGVVLEDGRGDQGGLLRLVVDGLDEPVRE